MTLFLYLQNGYDLGEVISENENDCGNIQNHECSLRMDDLVAKILDDDANCSSGSSTSYRFVSFFIINIFSEDNLFITAEFDLGFPQ